MRYGLLFLAVGAVLYVANVILIARHIKRGLPKLLRTDASLPRPARGEKYLWEQTAGTGLVPKWVSAIGLVAVLCIAIGAIIIFVAWVR